MDIPFRDTQDDWMKVLESLYDNKLTVNKQSKLTPRVAPDLLSGLSEETNLTEQEILDALRYLKSVDLVIMDINASKHDIEAFGGLTNEGLQLAHQIKTERQRRFTNLLLVLLTAVLTVLTIGLLGIELAPIFMTLY